MKPYSSDTIRRFIPAFATAACIAVWIYKQQNPAEELVFDFIYVVPLWGLWGLLVLLALWRNSSSEGPFWHSWSMAALSFLVALTPSFWHSWRGDPATVLFASTEYGGPGRMSLDFRQNGSYKFCNSGGIGASYFYGSYTRRDSLLLLDKSAIDNVIVSPRLVIRPERSIYEVDSIPGLDTVRETRVYQVDAQGKVIPQAEHFLVRP